MSGLNCRLIAWMRDCMEKYFAEWKKFCKFAVEICSHRENMTKEEYRQLLNSDYWKGYSYSLIKERNFTCEDCGRRFYGQRNKLQVHHLRYRDANPWSYSPDELVVLCDACHRKRHGLYYSNVENNKIATIAKWYNKLFYLLFNEEKNYARK